jgi:PleD family two-component response regulator
LLFRLTIYTFKHTKDIPNLDRSMLEKINLLVIDDDDINIFIIKKIVEKTGFDINMVSKSNGQQAIDYLKNAVSNSQNLHS